MGKTFEEFQKYVCGYRDLRFLFKKVEVMVERCTNEMRKRDAVLINEGAEGDGKSNASILEAGFIKSLTGRDIHLFFRLKEMMEFAQSTEGKIIIWDEPALDSLSSDAITSLNKDMTRLFMAIRKKRHFFLINYTKFWKFPEYIVVERALGMFRVYSVKEVQMGRFLYIKKSNLERLWNDHAKSKQKNYRKYSTFHGTFPEVMYDYFDSMDITINNKPHCTIKDYDDAKDEAIKAIGTKEGGMSKKELTLWKELNGVKYRVGHVTGEIQEKFAQSLRINRGTLREWSKIDLENTNLLGKRGFQDV